MAFKLTSQFDRADELDEGDPTRDIRELELCVPQGRIDALTHTLHPLMARVARAGGKYFRDHERFGVRAWSKKWAPNGPGWREMMAQEIGPRLGKLMGASADNVVLFYGISVALNFMVSAALVVRDGKKRTRSGVLMLKYPFRSDELAVKQALRLRYLDCDPNKRVRYIEPSGKNGRFTMEDFQRDLARHRHATGVLLIEGQPYWSGQVLPVAEIVRLAKQMGYVVIVNDVHRIGGVEMNLESADPECTPHMATGGGYKQVPAGTAQLAPIFVDMKWFIENQIWWGGGWWGLDESVLFAFGNAVKYPDTAQRLQLSCISPLLLEMWLAALTLYDDVGGISVVAEQALQRNSIMLDGLRQHPQHGDTFVVMAPPAALENPWTHRDGRGAELCVLFRDRAFGEAVAGRVASRKIGLDTRPAHFDPDKQLVIRAGLGPFAISHLDAATIAREIGLAVTHVYKRKAM